MVKTDSREAREVHDRNYDACHRCHFDKPTTLSSKESSIVVHVSLS